MAGIQITVSGDLHIHTVDPDLITQPILAALAITQGAVMSEADQINALSAKVDALIADVRAALAALAADRDNLGPDGQAALDSLTAKVDAFGAEVGDADGDGNVA